MIWTIRLNLRLRKEELHGIWILIFPSLSLSSFPLCLFHLSLPSYCANKEEEATAVTPSVRASLQIC